MVCTQNKMDNMTKTTKMMKVQAKMKSLMVVMMEMITWTQTKLERNPKHY